MDDIQHAQMVAGESAVVERLRAKGLMPPDPEAERHRLEQAALTAMKAEMRDNPFLAATCSTVLMVAMADLITFESSSTK